MAQYQPLDPGGHVLSPQDAAQLVTGYLTGFPEERLIAFYLDASGRAMGLVEMETGNRAGVDGRLRTLIMPALAHDAHAMLLAHNHPSGDPQPSAADLATTRRLAAVLKPLSIRLHDHLIVSHNGWRSMRADGLL